MVRFEFRLDPLHRVVPWGQEGEQSIHWFALTQGSYWLEVNGKEVLRYSQRAMHGDVEPMFSEDETHVHYFVARLFEDVIDIVPSCMQEVPEDIAEDIWTLGLVKLYRDWVKIAETIGWDELDEDSPVSRAIDWANSIHVDTRYLTSPLSMWFYRSGEQLYLEWAPDEDCPVEDWETPIGREKLNAKEFETACRDFSVRLQRQMKERIGLVAPGVTWPSVSIVPEHLLGESQRRSGWMDDAFLRVKNAAPEWHWGKIREAVQIARPDMGS